MNKRVTLTIKELKRIHVIQEIRVGRMTVKGAAEVLGLSVRQVRRLVKRQREESDTALAHGNCGRSSSRRLQAGIRKQIVELAKGTYRDYNNCHFQEGLAEPPAPIHISRSTLRTIRRPEGAPSPPKRRVPKHTSRRERKPQAGLLQADGSRHDWLEGRGSWRCQEKLHGWIEIIRLALKIIIHPIAYQLVKTVFFDHHPG